MLRRMLSPFWIPSLRREPAVEVGHLLGTTAARDRQLTAPKGMRFALQVSQFPWGADPRGWLARWRRAPSRSAGPGIPSRRPT